MAEEIIWERLSDMDPYDREERCRKAIRTLVKAIVMRVAAGILLIAAVIRAGAMPVATGLAVFVLLTIGAGSLPLVWELKKQRELLRQCLDQQKEAEKPES